jgi:aryl sulfotransferase
VRRYRGRTSDNARWDRFAFRDDDVVISTPSKCGTTWMQNIVGMRRHEPNVHLFHYQDLWDDLDGEMRRVARVLDVPIDGRRWPEFVEAATLESMRARAGSTAPEAHLSVWNDPQAFFRVGGRRDWAALLDGSDLDHFHDRLTELASDATPWILNGRTAL